MILLKQLSFDERDALSDLLRHEGFKALMKVAESLVREQEEALIKLSSIEGADRLMQEKLKSEGARKLRNELERFKDALLIEERKGNRLAPKK